MLLTSVFALALTHGSPASAEAEQPGEGVTVQPAVATWTSAVPVSWLFVELLEELGYEVQDPVALSNPVAYLAMTEGDVDYWPNGWFPLHDPQLPDNWDEVGTIFDPHCPLCTVQGYLVNVEAIEEYGITSISDFEDEDIRAAFDADGDGRADLFGCPPGWGCHEGINAMFEEFPELEEFLNHVEAGYAANFAEVLSRHEAGEPVLYYTWGPSGWVQALVPGEDVMWINAPGIVEDEGERAEGVPGAATDPIELGFVPADIQVAASNAFLEENPAAEELFNQVRVPSEWINEIDARIEEEGLADEDVQPLAREWIDDNRDTVDEWLDAARSAAAGE